jgi:hypothetical protein
MLHRVILEVNDFGEIYAPPAFCPYKKPEIKKQFHPSEIINHPELCGEVSVTTGRFLVHPSLCAICKACKFIPRIKK